MAIPLLTDKNYRRKFIAADPPFLSYSPTHKAKITKCSGCGSREFRDHHNRRICSYCRGEG